MVFRNVDRVLLRKKELSDLSLYHECITGSHPASFVSIYCRRLLFLLLVLLLLLPLLLLPLPTPSLAAVLAAIAGVVTTVRAGALVKLGFGRAAGARCGCNGLRRRCHHSWIHGPAWVSGERRVATSSHCHH